MISDVDMAALAMDTFANSFLAPDILGDDGSGSGTGESGPGVVSDGSLLDAGVDYLAFQATERINSMFDSNEREYAIVIYVNKYGDLVMSDLMKGTTQAEAEAQGFTSAYTTIYLPSDIGDGYILAVVHKHPKDQDSLANKPSTGDTQYYYNNLGKSYFSDDFAHYIVDPKGKVNEYDYGTEEKKTAS